MSRIDDGLALSIAGMVSVGLAEGNNMGERAVTSLIAIAMMVRHASDNPHVHEQLDYAGKVIINREPDGTLTMEMR